MIFLPSLQVEGCQSLILGKVELNPGCLDGFQLNCFIGTNLPFTCCLKSLLLCYSRWFPCHLHSQVQLPLSQWECSHKEVQCGFWGKQGGRKLKGAEQEDRLATGMLRASGYEGRGFTRWIGFLWGAKAAFCALVGRNVCKGMKQLHRIVAGFP